MSAPQNFRSAFNGFNREDVVRYLEYINTKHTTQVNQLNSEIDYLRARVETMQPDPALAEQRDSLQDRVQELEARCAELEKQLAAASQAEPVVVESAPIVVPAAPSTSDELEAYRRAERAERLARERASQIYTQASAVLADATVKVEAASDGINSLVAQLSSQLEHSKTDLQEAVAAMYAIRPTEE